MQGFKTMLSPRDLHLCLKPTRTSGDQVAAKLRGFAQLQRQFGTPQPSHVRFKPQQVDAVFGAHDGFALRCRPLDNFENHT